MFISTFRGTFNTNACKIHRLNRRDRYFDNAKSQNRYRFNGARVPIDNEISKNLATKRKKKFIYEISSKVRRVEAKLERQRDAIDAKKKHKESLKFIKTSR